MPSRFPLLATVAAAALILPLAGTAAGAPIDAPLPASTPIQAAMPMTPATSVAIPGDAAALPPVAPADAPQPSAPNSRDDVIRDARDAFLRHDRGRLAALRATALANRLQLSPWVDYWELTNRLAEVSSDEVEAFYARWPDSYVEDRLRNDWLLELGRRNDWTAFSRHHPRFRMNDDREVACYATLIAHLAGKDVHDIARAQWLAQKDVDNGCQLLAQKLYDDKVFSAADVWARLRQTAEFDAQRGARTARAAAQILGKGPYKQVTELWDNPARFLTRRGGTDTIDRARLAALAIARMAASDPGAAALQLNERWQSTIGSDNAAWAWALIAKHGAQSLLPDAVDWSDRAWAALKPRKGEAGAGPGWSDDVLAWHARAALRSASGDDRWRDFERAYAAMSPPERAEGSWVYWHARSQLALAKDGPAGEAARADARAALGTLSASVSFYGMLAAEDLGVAFALPPRPTPVSPLERGLAHANPGLQRALALVALDMRGEGRREWNYTLRGMSDRDLMAAAQWANDSGEWQLGINTSERTKTEIDIAQRYPMPFRNDITAAAQGAGLEPALVFGLIRQETRFMAQLRSSVGANGLMQLMPPTAKWAAKKAGIPYQPEMIADLDTNLRLGSFYLRMVLDSFGGSAPMAAAAYNAGPARSRRWRGTLMLAPEVWAENVPFLETRDYVKKVMTNAAVYAALLGNAPPQLRPRLGPQIGPRDAEQPAPPDMP
jgi:soluble lytic murein transglycosylase